jgi:serine/threonine protein kinase
VEGTPFGRYRLIDLLGRGGMGEVWRAHDTAADRIVAIKMLPVQYSDDPMFQQRFRREAQAAARLNSPHVIPIYDYGEIDGRLYVSMRLVEGRDLQAVIADGPLAPGRAVRIIEQVAKALHAAHKVGLVHRDVKPSNVLVDEDDFAYLIDFGIARATDDTRMTGTGNAIGTFQYMAPERMTDSVDDARADIYALACVLYECLTGQPPFAGSTLANLMYAHLHTPPPQASTTQPDVPAPLDAVIATGMAKDPDHRYPTTVELASAAHDAITTPLPGAAHMSRSPAQPSQKPPRTADRPATPPSVNVASVRPDEWVETPKKSSPSVERGSASTERAPATPVPKRRANDSKRPAPAVEPIAPTQHRHRWWRHKPVAVSAAIVIFIVIVTVATLALWGNGSDVRPGAQPSSTNPASSSPGAASANVAALSNDFATLQATLNATVGIALSAVGTGQSPIALGDWRNGPAWSTIHIPMVMAALRESPSTGVTDAMRAAITRSDDAAAEAIWQSLGTPDVAKLKVETVLADAGAPTIVQSQKVRPEFSAFGQTIWSLTDQVRFLSWAKCTAVTGPIFDLMGQVEGDQRWGLGGIENTQINGGWGPSLDGKYVVRQIGVIPTPGGLTAVAMAAEPTSGSFGDGTQVLTKLSDWLVQHEADLPGGQCSASGAP